jgi:Lipopolysaccharide-assembly
MILKKTKPPLPPKGGVKSEYNSFLFPLRDGSMLRLGSLFSLLIIHFTLFISSCGVYTFNSSSIDYEKIKTISVLNFTMATAGGPANLPLQLNEKLKEYYQRNTKLRVIPNNGDMMLEGTITGYEVLAAAPTSQDQAALNRLTVTVEVKFTNNKDETKNFEQNFSFYQDYPQGQTLSQNESRLVPKILDQIVQDIFNKSAGDW